MKIFLSYPRVNNKFEDVTEFREHLVNELQIRQPESTIFQDTENISEGDHFPEVIESELIESDVLLILLSPAWHQSEWCQREFETFTEKLKNEERLKCIIPVLWVSTPEVQNQPIDSIKDYLAAIHYRNWTKLRHENWKFAKKKEALSTLAEAILSLKKTVSSLTPEKEFLESDNPASHQSRNHPFPNIDQKLKPCQVAVCFVDIKGFEHFSMSDTQDNIVAQVITLFYQAINLALKHALNNVSPEIQRSTEYSHFVPSIAKPLGDGAMLVWELPEQQESIVRRLVCRFALDFYTYLQLLFNHDVKKLMHDDLINKSIGLVAGLTRGTAWKMVDVENDRFDYVGTTIKDAAKLQRAAVVNEILIQLKFEANLLMERRCFGEGAIRIFPGRNDMPVWSSIGSTSDVNRCRLLWRSARKDVSFKSAIACLEPLSEIKYNPNKIPKNPLSEIDIETIFESRQQWEAQFTAEMALRVKNGEILSDGEEIKLLESILKSMEELNQNLTENFQARTTAAGNRSV